MGWEEIGIYNFFIFISKYLLPEALNVEIKEKKKDQEEISLDDLLKKIWVVLIKELTHLSNIFCKKLYEKEVNNILNVLLKWILYKIQTPSIFISKTIKIKNLIICIIL